MTQQRSTALATILFTDLVSSTELLQRAGDEDAQRIFKTHHKLLRDAVAAAGGHEVKWLGDGLMVAFPSAADAVRCAVTMQRASRRPVPGGERLEIRVGLHAGEALIDESDYFGTTVVIARRLCDSAAAGQILCSALVSGLLIGRQAFAFRDAGPLALKGIAAPVQAAEVLYERDDPAAFLAQTPFVGRAAEVAKLTQKLREAEAGRGGLVMLVGEPGIGKTRTSEEFADNAVALGARVLRGRCFEGEWAPPYGPFAEAIDTYARDADPDELRADLGYGAPPIARLVPSLRERLPDIEEPAALQPDEERFRLLDAVSQFLIAISRRAPVVLMLDDLHWADRGTIAMMRHVARFAPQHRILVLGAYRDVELDRQHPLSDALAALRREVEYERVVLRGLDRDEVGTLLSTIAEQDVNATLVQAISDETDGNPFFIREVLIHLVEEGKLCREEGQWRSKAQSIAELGIPEGVRQVITRRLSRLSADANRLMTAASAFNGGFRFQTIAAVADLDEGATLDAIDEALDAQLLRPEGRADHYDFTHALIRHTLYSEMNPSRQVRLHRKIADVMSERVATYTPERQASHAAELAYQFHRSAAIPGAERGVRYALEAADYAEAAGAWDESVTYLRMALDLAPDNDARRPRLTGRLAIAQAWALRPEEAERNAIEAARLIAGQQGRDAAADYLADAQDEVELSGNIIVSWRLAAAGLEYIAPKRRDVTWARLAFGDLRRAEAEDLENPGIPVPSKLRDEIVGILTSSDDPFRGRFWQGNGIGMLPPYHNREEAMLFMAEETARVLQHPDADAMGAVTISAVLRVFPVGDLRGGLAAWTELADLQEGHGALVPATLCWTQVARVYYALGEIASGDGALQRAREFGARIASAAMVSLFIVGAEDERRVATGDWSGVQEGIAAIAGQQVIENRWAAAAIFAALGRVQAMLGRHDSAVALLAQVLLPLERAPGIAVNYTRVACNAAETLWITQRTDHIEAIERALREKVVAPDIRYPGVDGRLDLGRLCALQGRHDEAREWFARAREVLDEQGARPLRAIVDYDEALMYVRRGDPGDAARARPLLEAALAQMRDIGMTGWITRAEELLATLP